MFYSLEINIYGWNYLSYQLLLLLPFKLVFYIELHFIFQYWKLCGYYCRLN